MSPALTEQLQQAADTIAAPDVVLAFSDHNERTLVTSGSASTTGRAELYYEIGSNSKTFLGLLLAHLAHTGQISYNTPAHTCLPPASHSKANPAITLRHLITHTSGLPNLRHKTALYRGRLTDWSTNPFASYTRAQLLNDYHRHRTRIPPGTRWRYSNLGAAVCAHALASATTTPYPQLLTDHVLAPLGLHHTRLEPGPPGTNATGHRRNGTPALPNDLGALNPAGCLLATPTDLLTYLEAHLNPHTSPLHAALHAVRTPHTAPRPRHAPTRSLTWFTTHTPHGQIYFHTGGTFGQTSYLGYRPDTHTALVALANRRYDRPNTLINTAHTLLAGYPTPEHGHKPRAQTNPNPARNNC